jgi:hypothetical protein
MLFSILHIYIYTIQGHPTPGDPKPLPSPGGASGCGREGLHQDARLGEAGSGHRHLGSWMVAPGP